MESPVQSQASSTIPKGQMFVILDSDILVKYPKGRSGQVTETSGPAFLED